MVLGRWVFKGLKNPYPPFVKRRVICCLPQSLDHWPRIPSRRSTVLTPKRDTFYISVLNTRTQEPSACRGREGRTHSLPALVVWPLTTHPWGSTPEFGDGGRVFCSSTKPYRNECRRVGPTSSGRVLIPIPSTSAWFGRIFADELLL